MARLAEALESLGLQGEISSSGRWVRLQGEHSLVYVVETHWNARYFTWCDDPTQRTVEVYSDPVEAIRAGLLRSGRLEVPSTGRSTE